MAGALVIPEGEKDMTALDLSAYAPPEEHPDVTALKANVVRVMKKYTDRNGWCDEARQAMVEAGVIDARADARVMINVTLKQGFECTPVINVKDLLGKDEAAQKKTLASAIGSISLRSSGQGVVGTLAISDEDIIEMALPAAPEPGWRRATDNSRALHHFTAEAIERAQSGRHAWVYPACGIEAYGLTVRQDNGSVTRHCVACTKALARNP